MTWRVIDLIKRMYQVNTFLISPQKHMLCVLIRSAKTLLMSTHNICFSGKIRNTRGVQSISGKVLQKFKEHVNLN